MTLDESWTLGTTYNIEFDPDLPNNSIEITINGDSTTVPTEGNEQNNIRYIEIGNTTVNSGNSRSVYLDEIRTGAREYGEVVVSFDTPLGTIESWNALRWDETLDSETITVDVEDSADDSTLIADVSDYEDLSGIATGVTPQFRFKLSRSSNANNPTVDYVEETWTHLPGDSVPKSGGTMTGDLDYVSGATATFNGNEVWHAGNDGAGTGLHADLLDGNHASAFATWPDESTVDNITSYEYKDYNPSSSSWHTLLNVSGSGTFLNGLYAHENSANKYDFARITVDGNQFSVEGFEAIYIDPIEATFAVLPPVQFESSLEIEIYARYGNDVAAHGFIQW